VHDVQVHLAAAHARAHPAGDAIGVCRVQATEPALRGRFSREDGIAVTARAIGRIDRNEVRVIAQALRERLRLVRQAVALQDFLQDDRIGRKAAQLGFDHRLAMRPLFAIVPEVEGDHLQRRCVVACIGRCAAGEQRQHRREPPRSCASHGTRAANAASARRGREAHRLGR